MLSIARAVRARVTTRLPCVGGPVVAKHQVQIRSLSSPSPNEKRSTAVPHGMIFMALAIPTCLFALYNVRFGPSEEEQIKKVEERYKKEIDDNSDNYTMQLKMIQKSIANPDSMDAVSRELLDSPKASSMAQTKRLMSPEEAKAAVSESDQLKASKTQDNQSTEKDSGDGNTKKRPWWKVW